MAAAEANNILLLGWQPHPSAVLSITSTPLSHLFLSSTAILYTGTITASSMLAAL